MDLEHALWSVPLLLTACLADTGRPSPVPVEEPADTTPAPVRPRDAAAFDVLRPVSADAAADAPAASAVDAPVPDARDPDRSEPATCAPPLCLDFEAQTLPAAWKAQSASIAIERGRAAGGDHALRFTNLQPKQSRTVSTTQLPGISNVLWGRFYLYVTPGAPNGHGALVTATDQAGNWYELGFQHNAYHGNYHPPGGERWMNSKVVIPADRWVCVEFLFDGATPATTKIWSDGIEVPYSQSATGPALIPVQQFAKVEVGFRAFHGTSLRSYSNADPPALTDLWIDDLALGSTRRGCLARAGDRL